MQDCQNILNTGSCSSDNCAYNHNILYCDKCSFTAKNAAGFGMHIRSDRHRRGGKNRAAFKAVIKNAEKNKNGVIVDGELDFGIIEQNEVAKSLQRVVRIQPEAPSTKILFASVKLNMNSAPSSRRVTPPFSLSIENRGHPLSSANPATVTVSLTRRDVGRHQAQLELGFENMASKKRFVISRTIQAIVGDSRLHQQLKPTAPYIPRRPTAREPETNVVKGVKPPALSVISYATPLPRPEIPPRLLATLNASSSPWQVQKIKDMFLSFPLHQKNHGEFFKILIWIEEHRMEYDLQRYDMPDSTLASHMPYYYLEVPGLAEKRPSVLTGDRILVRKHDGPVGHWYAGHVHFVRQYEVGLRFHQSFNGWTPTQKYHVRFKLNKIPIWRQHQALNVVFNSPRLLFPEPSYLPKGYIPNQDSAKPFNSLIASNPCQLQAVTAITNALRGSLPFIVFGPPGTGKTMTVVEAIKQLVKKKPDTRILACAPSNAAADLIATRLRDSFNIDELFRLYAPSRHKDQVPDDLMQYSYYHEMPNSRPCFGAPSIGRMKRFRIVIATCVSASIISGIGMPRGHFTHIFIDESGQATEPEALVPIKMMAGDATNVILSGDPKQLGPIVRSVIASKLGLELSYLERLMRLPVYDLKKYAGKSIVKLVKNFRSHDAILKYPNQKFYEGDLQACADTAVAKSYLGSPWLSNKDFPIVFHSVSGKDDREATSPSFFNIDEVILVKRYVEQLKADRKFRTSDHDIGVITPYHAQCQKIRSALRNVADEIKVASVEDFQGQERKVIIISTVRSSKEFISYDILHTLGFVASPRRFNVSITRAKALLIVIGDPQVLGLDPLWRSFLNYIHDNNGWKGPEIPWDSTEAVNEAGGYDSIIRDAALLDMNEFTRRMEALALGGEVVVKEEEEDMDVGIDRPWRNVE